MKKSSGAGGPGRRPRLRRWWSSTAAMAAMAVLTAGGTGPVSAAPDTKRPGKVTGVRIGSVNATGFVVRFPKVERARRYRVWTASHPSLLTPGSVGLRRTAASAKRRVRVTVPVAGTPWYVKVEAIGSRRTTRTSSTRVVHLRPLAPVDLGVQSSMLGLSLTWNGQRAERYLVQQATDPSMRTGLRTWRTMSQARSFTPTDLRIKQRYWFRVRAQNGARTSRWTAPVSAVAQSYGVTVRVMTWNVLRRVRDGVRYPSGERVGDWSTVRGPAVVNEIRRSGADLIVLQEAGDNVTGPAASRTPGLQQVQWIAQRLGPRWQMTLSQKNADPRGTGTYMLYDTRTLSNGIGHHRALFRDKTGHPTYTTYASLTDRRTGAQFGVLGTHLHQGLSGADDVRRGREAQALVDYTRYIRKRYWYDKHPRVYVGDLNSDRGPRYPKDSAGDALDAARLVDTDTAATYLSPTSRYDSYHQLNRTPPATGTHIDQIRPEPGIGVRAWQMLAPINNGRNRGALASDHFPVMADIVIPWYPGGPNHTYYR